MRGAIMVVLTVLTAVLIWWVLIQIGPDWRGFTPATCLSTHCFCERPQGGALLLQPANALSSLGFVAVGWWIILGATGARTRALGGAATLWFGFTAIVIGVGSVLLHATLTLWGQFADVLGMYLLGSFTLVWAVMRWRTLRPALGIALYIVVAGGLIALLWLVPDTRRWVFAVVLGVAIAVEWTLARPMRRGVRGGLLLAAVAANAAAFGIWIADQTRLLCAPDSFVQGHAVWHLLGAAAVALSYVYYAGERR